MDLRQVLRKPASTMIDCVRSMTWDSRSIGLVPMVLCGNERIYRVGCIDDLSEVYCRGRGRRELGKCLLKFGDETGDSLGKTMG